MINLQLTLAADDTDVLQTARSILRRAPADGEYRIWWGSDQADGLLDIKRDGMNVLEPSNTRVITVGVLERNRKPDVSFKVKRMQEVVINYNEVTGGTATIFVEFLDMVDLMFEAGLSPSRVVAELTGRRAYAPRATYRKKK